MLLIPNLPGLSDLAGFLFLKNFSKKRVTIASSLAFNKKLS